jgi:SAM-dependent methyltransferase
MADQAQIDEQNRGYWNTLCGNQWARALGVTDFSIASLSKFDTYYLSYYPYLLEHVPIHAFWGKKVLEVGLGYGTLSQLLAAACEYNGLDIAPGPVNLVNERLHLHGLTGAAQEGSILDPPFGPESFDVVVSIGCLHHTGDLPAAIDKIRLLLKPGGKFVFMVYNAYSYRRWLRFFRPTVRSFASEYFGLSRVKATSEERSAYDAGTDGGAPETEFFSSRQLKRLLSGFREIRITKENGDSEAIFQKWDRARVRRIVSPQLGLDLYVSAVRK